MNKLKDLPGGFKLFPPAPDVCQACAVNHEPEAPHNQQSLYYQYHFYADHGRWPTWNDAMAHCPENIKKVVKEVLRKNGIEEVDL